MRRSGTALVCGVLIAAPSCSDYGAAVGPDADAAIDASGDATVDASASTDATVDVDAGCPRETCEGRVACTTSDFATNNCDPWEFVGDVSSTTHDCSAGRLRLFARDTNDIVAKLVRQTPGGAYRVHVALRINIADWDGGRVLRIVVGGASLVDVRASSVGGGSIRLTLCEPDGQCSPQERQVPANTEHLLELTIAANAAVASLDCVSLGMTAVPAPLLTASALDVLLGKTDAQSIEGTFDDVVVWFEL